MLRWSLLLPLAAMLLLETVLLVYPCDVLAVHFLPRSQRGPMLGSKVTSKGLPVVKLSSQTRLDPLKPGL